MNTKKMLLLSLVVMLVASVITACSGSTSKNENASQKSGDNSKVSEGSGEVAKKEPVTFTIFNGVSGTKDINSNETTIGKLLEEQTGVNFKLEYLVGDLTTKIGTMIASNKYPDVLIPDAAIEEVLNAGGFIPLDDLIEEHGPNIKRVYGPYLDQLKAKDGKLYILPFGVQVGDYMPNPEPSSAFWIQRRVLADAGYPEVKTLDQYLKLIRDYEAKHKDENLTGMVALTHDWRFFATANPPMHLMGGPNDGNVVVDLETYEAKTYAGTDATKRWLKALNDLNASGLFDKASFVDNYDQYIAKLTSHKVLGFMDQTWQAQNALNVLKDEARLDPTLDGYRYLPLPVTFDESIKDGYVDPQGGIVKNRGAGITVSAADPARIIQFWDNLLKEENQRLVTWGIQGETYEVDDKGRFYRTEEQILKINEAFNEKFGFKQFGWNWPSYGATSTFSDGNAVGVNNQPEVFQMSLTKEDKQILEKYGAKTFSDLFAEPVYRPWYPTWGFTKEQNSPEQLWELKKEELQKKYFPKMVLATPDKFDAAWDEYINEFNKLDTAGYEKWTTEQVKVRVEQANAK